MFAEYTLSWYMLSTWWVFPWLSQGHFSGWRKAPFSSLPNHSLWQPGQKMPFGGFHRRNNSFRFIDTLLGTNISPEKSILKMIFLFPRWDMLISWRVNKGHGVTFYKWVSGSYTWLVSVGCTPCGSSLLHLFFSPRYYCWWFRNLEKNTWDVFRKTCK